MHQVGDRCCVGAESRWYYKIVSFFSSMHTKTERKSSETEQELLAVVKSIKHFRPYLLQN
jgi:hypothetical protein